MNENDLQAITDLRIQPSGRKEHGKGHQEMLCCQKRSARGRNWPSGVKLRKLAGWSVGRF